MNTKAQIMALFDLVSGRWYLGTKQAAKALGVSIREAKRLVVIGWLVVVPPPR